MLKILKAGLKTGFFMEDTFTVYVLYSTEFDKIYIEGFVGDKIKVDRFYVLHFIIINIYFVLPPDILVHQDITVYFPDDLEINITTVFPCIT